MPHLLQRSLQQSKSLDADDNDDDDDDGTVDTYVSFRSPRLSAKRKPILDENDELTDDIKIRLEVARNKAMEKYREIWG